jgi:hypothetical protein
MISKISGAAGTAETVPEKQTYYNPLIKSLNIPDPVPSSPFIT